MSMLLYERNYSLLFSQMALMQLFGKVSSINFIKTSNKIPKHCIFDDFFLIEG